MLLSPSYAKSVAHHADVIQDLPACLLLHFTAGVSAGRQVSLEAGW